MSELVSNQASGSAKIDSGTALSRVLNVLADVQSESLRGLEHYPVYYANKYAIVRAQLEEIAADLPCWVIVSPDGSEYLRRYTIGRMADGSNVYLHCFMSSDKDQELHCHPWPGTSFILAGGYDEERRGAFKNGVYSIDRFTYRPGDISVLRCDTFHRVDLTNVERRAHAETWTLFITAPKQAEPDDSGDAWGFWSRVTGEYIPWRTFMRTHGIDPKGTSDSLKLHAEIVESVEPSAEASTQRIEAADVAWWRQHFTKMQSDVTEAVISLASEVGSTDDRLSALAFDAVTEIRRLRARVASLEAAPRRGPNRVVGGPGSASRKRQSNGGSPF